MNKRLILLTSIIFAIALFRVLPHPPNVTPVAALALFGGAYLSDRRLALIIPFLALLLSDLIIGLHDSMLFVYAGFGIAMGFGYLIRNRICPSRVISATLASSIVFFIVTNFGAWMSHAGMYPRTLDGLMAAYVAGIPFFQNTLAGDLFFSAVIFGGYALLLKNMTTLQKPVV